MSRQLSHPVGNLASHAFARTALFSALASTLVGFGAAPALAADTNTAADIGVTTRKVVSTAENNTKNSANSTPTSASDDEQLNAALDALHLKKAVEQNIIDQSVLDDYSEQTLGIKPKKAANSGSVKTSQAQNSQYQSSQAQTNQSKNLQQQAQSVQQQGYQMMSPEQIDRELAAMTAQNGDSFDAPVATLKGNAAPIGLDVSLDAASLPAPTNLDTLGVDGVIGIGQSAAEIAEIVARPINVSDSVNSRDTNSGDTKHGDVNPSNTTVNNRTTTGNTNTADSAELLTDERTPVSDLNPDDYLPDYEADAETDTINDSIEQANNKKSRARKPSNFIKRAYNRLFNGGAMALPHVDTTVYIQQAAAKGANRAPKLIKADADAQPINNIKAALDDTTVQSVADFTAALPRLRQTALEAARAVGYYDVTLNLRQPNADSIDVIIENLGEPVRVDSHIVDIRGEGSEQAEYQALESNLPPQEGEIFNHRVYKNSKAALEALSNTYGYFDQYWLNKSVDIILPDNTADVSLIYDTGARYEFDDVVFFTYDKASGTLTRDPDKLPVELPLLRQLFDFKEGDPFYRPDITKFSNDLSATRYFNIVNVETILPPDERSENSTLAFDNTPTSNTTSNGVLDDDVDNGDSLLARNGSSATNSVNGDGSNRVARAAMASADSTDTNDATNSNDSDDSDNANSGATVNAADIAPIDFEIDEQTSEKLQAVKQKAERLSRLPDDRVLDEKSTAAKNILGKVSDAISNVAQKIFPDDEVTIDENFVPPTLAGRKTPEQVQASKKVPLYVFVSSDKPRDAQVGIGYGTDTGVRATAKIDYNLLNRKGYQAGAEAAVSRINKNATVYASRPWNHPLDDKLEGRLAYEEELIDQGEGNFDLSTKTLKARVARNIHNDKGWDRSYFMRYRLDELETGLDQADLRELPVRFTSSSPTQQALLLGYGMSKSHVDNIANPTRGYRQYYSIEAGSEKALSDTDLAIVNAGLSGIYSFGADKKHQVLGQLSGGYIWADDFYDVPYKLRFFAGGDQSIRGYDYNSLSPLENGYLTGGQILAVGSAEYNYEFKPGFRGAVFTDVGNAYDKDFEADTKVGVGVGIRWASPVGVVRVDVAAGVTEDDVPVRLHFFIGSPL